MDRHGRYTDTNLTSQGKVDENLESSRSQVKTLLRGTVIQYRLESGGEGDGEDSGYGRNDVGLDLVLGVPSHRTCLSLFGSHRLATGCLLLHVRRKMIDKSTC